MKYRVLKAGEVIREGDEYLSDSGLWRPTSCNGDVLAPACFGRYRSAQPAQPVKAVENSVTISRRDAKKLFKLAKAHCKREIEDNEWRFGPDNDEQEWRTFLKALRKLEKETLNPK